MHVKMHFDYRFHLLYASLYARIYLRAFRLVRRTIKNNTNSLLYDAIAHHLLQLQINFTVSEIKIRFTIKREFRPGYSKQQIARGNVHFLLAISKIQAILTFRFSQANAKPLITSFIFGFACQMIFFFGHLKGFDFFRRISFSNRLFEL